MCLKKKEKVSVATKTKNEKVIILTCHRRKEKRTRILTLLIRKTLPVLENRKKKPLNMKK